MVQKTVIESSQKSINLKELWEYRDLIYTLALRDFKVKYAQTFLGFLWAIFQPLVIMFVFYLVFKKTLNIDTNDVPYPVFAMTGMVAWTYFNFVLVNAGSSIIMNRHLVAKIYFPRMVIPISKAMVGLIDFGISFLLLLVIMVVFQFMPSANIIYLPLFIFYNLISSLTIGLWLSALTIRYRDLHIALPYMMQALMFITPVAYPIGTISGVSKWFFYLNPVTLSIEGFRWSVLGSEGFDVLNFWPGMLFTIVMLIGSFFYFKKVEETMADII